MPSFSLPPLLAQALDKRGYAELTPVQQAVIEGQAETRDLLVSARTGSGKTVAYGLAMAGDLLVAGGALPPPAEPLALIIAPTRELALQVQRELEWLYAEAGARVVSCVGGMDPRREQRALAAGAHIVVGTPGRLRDHLDRNNLQVSGLSVIVVDEADEMLDLGFREELEALLDAAPSERRTLMFSATLPKPIVALARRYQREALHITVDGARESHADIEYRAIAVAPGDVEHAVVNVLRFYEAGAALVFCNTREAVRRLHANLVERGFSVVGLSGELTQNERNHALQALRDRRARVCVATDVAARGIDIPDLELVIHAELPNDLQSLQHRSGRTGRAGKKGVSIVIAPYPRRRRAEAMLRDARIEAPWGPAPSAEEIRERDQARLIAALHPEGEAAEEDLAVARALLADCPAETLVAGLVRARREALPSPEDMVEAMPEPPPSLAGAAPRAGFEGSVWFCIDMGRNRNAEARWMLPLICRRGHVTKREIGAIRVFDRETRFEIMGEAADRFEAALGEGEDEGMRIERLASPDLPPARDRRPFKKAHGKKPPGGPDRRAAEPAWEPRIAPAPPPVQPERPTHPQTSKRQKAKFKGPKKSNPNAGKPKHKG